TSITSSRSGNEAGAPGRERSRCAKPRARAADALSVDAVMTRTLPYRACVPNFLVGVLRGRGSGPARGRPALIYQARLPVTAIIGPPPIAVAIRPVTVAVVVGPVIGVPIVAAIGVIAVAAIVIADIFDWRSLSAGATQLRQRGCLSWEGATSRAVKNLPKL